MTSEREQQRVATFVILLLITGSMVALVVLVERRDSARAAGTAAAADRGDRGVERGELWDVEWVCDRAHGNLLYVTDGSVTVVKHGCEMSR